jgi:uncharacterized protein (DUF2252 family)
MSKTKRPPSQLKDRASVLSEHRKLKMARSAHAYVRGNTQKFYEWLQNAKPALPLGPPVWICGDCHVGNLGPIANAKGNIDIQIRDLDQTVIGNPAHDLIRLGLSLATAARGSDLPGVITAQMMAAMMEGYALAFDKKKTAIDEDTIPAAVRLTLKRALRRSWKHLAQERIEDTTPSIPLGKRFWPLMPKEKKEILRLFETDEVRRLVTLLRSRDDEAEVKVLDAAYWQKGCSSLGLMRYAVLVSVRGKKDRKAEVCLIDIKEAAQALAPRYSKSRIPRDNAARVVEGARHISPHLGGRMIPARFLDASVFIRELLPQDLKLEIEEVTPREAVKAARFLSHVVGRAHARQMDEETRRKWLGEIKRSHSRDLEAPSWLWLSVVELIATHEQAYLEHCRKYALQKAEPAEGAK